MYNLFLTHFKNIDKLHNKSYLPHINFKPTFNTHLKHLNTPLKNLKTIVTAP